jgi:transcriptional regulator GlxA family with amidase domain
MRISVLALEGFFDTGLAVTLDAFKLANKFSTTRMGGTPHFDVAVVGTRQKVKSGQGFSIPVSRIATSAIPDWVIVPALSAGSPDQLQLALKRRDVEDAKGLLQKWHAKGVHIGAACIGSFILADAGLLDHREATTTWWMAPFFRQRYPTVSLDETRMLVQSGQVVTAGALMGHLDLALWLIRKASPELATTVARYFLADIRSSQAQYIIPNQLAQADPLMARFEKWSRDHLRDGFSLQGAADALAVSTRALQRRCEAVLGKSPLAYFQDLRVEHAQTLIHKGGMGIEAIAAEVGYDDGATLRSLLRRRLGRGVRELRSALR